jgi:hypothetical protein
LREARRINPAITAENNLYVRMISDAEERAKAIESFRRAGLG